MKTRNDELRERPQTTNQVDRDLRARSGLRFAYVCFALAAFFALCGILAANAATVTNRAVAYDAATGRITTPTNIWAVAGIDTNDDENIAAHSNLIVAAQADATAALDTNALLWANQSAHSNLIDNIEADATAISNLVVAAQADATAALDTNALLWANQSAHSNLIDILEADDTAISNLVVAAQADATAALDTNALLWANQAAHSNLLDSLAADDTAISNLVDILEANQSAHTNLLDSLAADDTAISNLVDTLEANQSAHSNLIDNLEADTTAISNLVDAVELYTNKAQTAYSWGDHADAGYLTTLTNLFASLKVGATNESLGSNLATNGTFTGSAAGWTLTNFTYLNNGIHLSAGLSGSFNMTPAETITTGRMYFVTMELDTSASGESGSITLGGDSAGIGAGADRTISAVLYATNSNPLNVSLTAAIDGVGVDDVTVQEVTIGDVEIAGIVRAAGFEALGTDIVARIAGAELDATAISNLAVAAQASANAAHATNAAQAITIAGNAAGISSNVTNVGALSNDVYNTVSITNQGTSGQLLALDVAGATSNLYWKTLTSVWSDNSDGTIQYDTTTDGTNTVKILGGAVAADSKQLIISNANNGVVMWVDEDGQVEFPAGANMKWNTGKPFTVGTLLGDRAGWQFSAIQNGFLFDDATDEAKFGVSAQAKRRWIFTNGDNYSGRNYDRPLASWPTICIFGMIDPNQSNNEYVEFWHDGTNANYSTGEFTGVGTAPVTIAQKHVFWVGGTNVLEVNEAGLDLKEKPGFPAPGIGKIVYNSTSNALFCCDGTNWHALF